MNARASIGSQALEQLHVEHMRVTSIPYSSTNMVIFSGVPLAKDSYRTNSGKYFVTIKASPDAIPVSPAIGQHWIVKGARTVQAVETGDYMMQHDVVKQIHTTQLSSFS